MGENPKAESAPSAARIEGAQNAAHPLDDAETRATLQAIHAGIGQTHEVPAATAAQPALETGEKIAGRRNVSWPRVALVSFLAVIAVFAGAALYLSSRHAAAQTAAIEKFGQSLDRVEQKIAFQSSSASQASAADTRKNTPADADLLEAANAHFREGQFTEAVISFRAAAAADTGGQLSDETRYRYGTSLAKTGDSNGALREFQAVVTGFPGSPYFAASVMETARLLIEQKQYARARQTLCQVLAARDRLSAADKDHVARATFLVGRCLEGEAESLEAAQSVSLPVARYGPADPTRSLRSEGK